MYTCTSLYIFSHVHVFTCTMYIVYMHIYMHILMHELYMYVYVFTQYYYIVGMVMNTVYYAVN